MGLLRIRVVEKSPKKRKFRNAEAARKDKEERELEAKMLAAHGIVKTKKRKPQFVDAKGLPTAHLKRQLAFQASLGRMPVKAGSRPDPVAVNGRQTGKKEMVYTGSKMKGIATMHKSNAVPTFSDEEAVEISQMRR